MAEQSILFDEVKKIIDILIIIKNKIDDNTGLVGSRFETPQSLISYIDFKIQELQSGMYASFDNINILFAPTGTMQEISISNGWAEEFLQIAAQFDDAYSKFENNLNKNKN